MGTKIQPQVITYVCDGCGKESSKAFDCRMELYLVGRDFQGQAVGGNTANRDLCGACVGVINKALADLKPKEGSGDE